MKKLLNNLFIVAVIAGMFLLLLLPTGSFSGNVANANEENNSSMTIASAADNFGIGNMAADSNITAVLNSGNAPGDVYGGNSVNNHTTVALGNTEPGVNVGMITNAVVIVRGAYTNKVDQVLKL